METTEASLYTFHDSDVIRMDDEIVTALEEVFEYTIGRDFFFEFEITADDFYDVLSIVDAHNAPVLIQVGLRDKASVRDFLLRQGLRHLIHNNAELVETAKRSNVMVEDYMELCSAAHWSYKQSYDDLIRALEFYKELDGKRFCQRTILPLIVRGLISYETVEAIGYPTLERNSSRGMVVSTLMAVEEPNNGVHVSADHIKKALNEGLVFDQSVGLDDMSRLTAKVDGRLNLMVMFGGEEGLRFKNPAMVHHVIRQQWSVYRKKIDLKFAFFIDEMETALETITPAVLEMEALYSAGVDAHFASETIKSESEWTVNRIIALHAGSASALTEGWL